MQKYFEVNKDHQNIRCKLYFEKGRAIEKVVLFGHGFAGHKDNKTAERFADRLLTKFKGVALVTFDLPCHGDDVKKKLVLQDCLTYLNLVIDHIKSEIGAEKIYSYATSFGAYLVLKYIAERGNPFEKIVLRAPAINMYESIRRNVINENELEEILKGKDTLVGFDRKVWMNRQFLDDLRNSDIRKLEYYDFADDILIIHGTKDEVIPPETSRSFAENNVIEFLPIENADHRFQNLDYMEAATKKTIEFFGL